MPRPRSTPIAWSPSRWVGHASPWGKIAWAQPKRWHPAHLLRGSDATDTEPAIVDNEPEHEKLRRLAAVLFLAKEPLSSRKLSEFGNLADGKQARTLIGRLNQRFDETGRAFRVEAVAAGFQLVTRPQFSKWLRRVEHVPGEVRLSAPALETLAVVAYRQPVMRAEVEAIRGVSCGEMLAQLLNRDLIRIGGRSEELGRPYLYKTTKRFLQVFGLRSLDNLPRADVWRSESEASR